MFIKANQAYVIQDSLSKYVCMSIQTRAWLLWCIYTSKLIYYSVYYIFAENVLDMSIYVLYNSILQDKKWSWGGGGGGNCPTLRQTDKQTRNNKIAV